MVIINNINNINCGKIIIPILGPTRNLRATRSSMIILFYNIYYTNNNNANTNDDDGRCLC